ncbi:FluC/FEX family fluoride channel [Pseudonocardia lacus]|uniref:FluC/FEX family fluoride channel n=1 Tax=Pseudonocardia lacus TaxID=2835865 RepID=UPI001BDC269F|nr:CrcB family protein [Pseudonocardia lacus]
MRPPAPSRSTALAAIAAGGVVGCLARYGLGQALPTPPGGWPTGTFLANLSGCLALGFLLEHLARRGPDVGRRRVVRLGLGTGLLGSYTTYSTFAVEVDLLIRDGAAALAVGYAAASTAGGLLAVGAGVAAAGALGSTR